MQTQTSPSVIRSRNVRTDSLCDFIWAYEPNRKVHFMDAVNKANYVGEYKLHHQITTGGGAHWMVNFPFSRNSIVK